MHKIGINQVLLQKRISGAQQRELTIFPLVVKKLIEKDIRPIIYISANLEEEVINNLIPDNKFVDIIKTPLPSVPTYKRVLKGITYWKDRVKKDELDIFHTAYYPAPKLNIPVVFTLHDLRFKQLPYTYSFGRRNFLNYTVPLSLKRSSHIITISEDSKKDIIDFYKYDKNNITISHNVISDDFLKKYSVQDISNVKKKYNLPENYFLYVGHLEKRKNLERLIKAYSILLKNNRTNNSLVILGKPSYGGYNDLLSKNNLEELKEKVIFTGYVEDKDLFKVYQAAVLLAFPSLHEGFGIPVLEAMASGIPVLTSNVAALPEIAGDAACLVDPYNVDSISYGMNKILFDNNYREKLIKKGYEQIKKFNVEESAQKIVDVYTRFLK